MTFNFDPPIQLPEDMSQAIKNRHYPRVKTDRSQAKEEVLTEADPLATLLIDKDFYVLLIELLLLEKCLESGKQDNRKRG